MKRSNCKECPWVINNTHNTNFINGINKMVENGVKKTTKHQCHMIENVDHTKSTTEKNVCIGSLNKSKNEI